MDSNRAHDPDNRGNQPLFRAVYGEGFHGTENPTRPTVRSSRESSLQLRRGEKEREYDRLAVPPRRSLQ